jgi:hypothetical protein
MWYQKFDTYILVLGLTRSKVDHCVYFKLVGDHIIYLVLYMDDMLLIGNNKKIIEDVKTQWSSKFDLKYFGVIAQNVTPIHLCHDLTLSL